MIIRCPGCKEEISDEARQCPVCGYSIRNEARHSEERRGWQTIEVFSWIILLVGSYLFGASLIEDRIHSLWKEWTLIPVALGALGVAIGILLSKRTDAEVEADRHRGDL